MSAIPAAAIEAWIRDCAGVFAAHKEELTALDAAIGDADHGANMARGFAAVPAKLDALAQRDVGSLCKATAMTLISQVGGASGPLYGTFFLQASKLTAGKTELTLEELSTAFEAGLQGIVGLGKAAVGDKTMVDALTPALAALKVGGEPAEALARAAAAAQKAAEGTIPLVARKGRASYLGERSAGHKDPGAASLALLLEALARAVGKST